MKCWPRFINLALMFVIIISVSGFIPETVHAAPSALRISQIYGGGGNSGATYTHDFIEIFNSGDTPVSLDGLSLQYASATGTGNFGANVAQLTVLPDVMLQPGQYFLVQEATGTTGDGDPLPTPDYADPSPINMSAGSGKVVLVTGTTSLGCNGGSNPCDAVQLVRIIDLVGYGSTNFYEGSSAAPTLSNTTAALRAGGGCMDTDDNAADFTADTPSPRNSASPTNTCDLAPIVMRVSQVYGGGGNSGAYYTHDFIELFNAGDAPVDITGWSVQYASATGSTWQVTSLSGTIQPGGYYLVQQAQGAGGTAPLPTPDAIGSIFMSATNGKVALVDNTTALSGTCPKDVVDFVGFGSNANCFEGSGPTATLSNTTAAIRDSGGCGDTDDNAADFSVGEPTPRNSTSPANICSLDPPPYVSSTIPENNAVGVALDSNIEITFNEFVTVTDPWFEISCSLSGLHSGIVTSDNPTFTINPEDDFLGAETCSVTIFADKVSDQGTPPNNMVSNYSFSFKTLEACGDPFTPIYDIQGSGNISPLIGQTLATEGVIVGDFSSPERLNGFFIQDPIGDGDFLTSDGIFVYVPPANPFHTTQVSEGDLVRVQARVAEFFSMTQLDFVESLVFCDTGISIEPTSINLPVLEPVDGVPYLERYEGMLVTFPQELTVTDNFNLGRFGEVTLSVGGRLFNPTNTADPGPDANALQALNDRRQIMLDDGSNLQNPIPPPPYFGQDGTLRAGDTTLDLTGVINFAFSVYRVQPTIPVNFTRINERSEFPQQVGGVIRVASFNVLNYFTTLDTGAPICGPNQDQGCRGANTPEEFVRQRVKIIEAILRLDADVIGLIELENNPYESLQDLVNGLNDATGPGTYDFIDTGTIGGDAIKQGIIYMPSRVIPLGDFAILDSSVDARFLDDKNRPVLAQTFDASGEIFTVAINHLKSKGSDCNDVGDPDLGDGQGNCNLTRTNAALALVDWLASDPTGSNDPDFFIIGDLNAYRNEDPITAIKEEGGYVDLIDKFIGPQAYSYVFFGQAGYLDHALASPNLTDRVTGVTLWAINADEPRALDYNDFNQPSLFQPHQYRSSDHDPVLIGFCDAIAPTLEVNVTPNVLWPPNHQYVRVTATVSLFDNFDPHPTLALVSVTSNEPDNGLGDGDMPDDIVIIDDFTFDLRAERSGLGNGRIYTITYQATDSCGNTNIASATVFVPFDLRQKR
jgi:uncharacterized protein